MALPSGITTCTLTLGADVDPSGDDVAARWTITPVVLRGGRPEPVKLVHATTGVAIIPIPEVVTVGPGGTATIVLPRTSDANIVDAATNLEADWVYLAECRWQRGRDSDFTARKAFRLTTATADFDLVSPVELVPASTPIMTVAPHDHSSIYPSRTEVNNLIQGITGVDVSGVVKVMGDLPTGADLNTYTTPGVWSVPSLVVASTLLNAPAGANAGVLEVLRVENASIQRYSMVNSWDRPRVLERASNGPWVSMTPVPEGLATSTNLDTVLLPGRYTAVTDAVSTTITGMPAAVAGQPFALDVVRQPISATAYRVVQDLSVFAFTTGQPPRRFVRQLDQGFVSDWAEIVTSKPMAPAGHKRDMLLQASRIRRGGRIGTHGATPIALSFDHGFVKFRDLILPELRRLGLPATIAVCTDDLGTGENAGISYPEIQSWAINYGLEVANHGRSHGDRTTEIQVRNAIINNSLTALRAGLPKLVVDSFILPGVTSPGSWMGFDHGADYTQWWDHNAGRYILDEHAVTTAAILGRMWPQTGDPVQTIDRIGFDTTSWADTITTLIPRLHGSGMGTQIFCHPNLINNTNQITMARVTTLLEFLASERDAGRVEVLTVSGYAWADPDSARRPDLATLNGGFVGGVCTLQLAHMPWARGGQWRITAEGAGPVTIAATDNTNTLNVNVSGTNRARAIITIPTDATTITITIPATATATIHAV